MSQEATATQKEYQSIQQNYYQACAQLGELHYRKFDIENAISQANTKIANILIDFKKVEKKLQKEKAEADLQALESAPVEQPATQA